MAELGCEVITLQKVKKSLLASIRLLTEAQAASDEALTKLGNELQLVNDRLAAINASRSALAT